MEISGLSNQWQSRERLFSDFARIDPGTKVSELPEWAIKFSDLIHALEDMPGPDLFIGSSVSWMNFNNRDVRHPKDHVPSFAFLEIVDDNAGSGMTYRITTREIVGNRPTAEWVTQYTPDSEIAAAKILSLIHI